MPATVAELIKNNPDPVYVAPEVPLQEALAQMLSKEYSQLPVTDSDRRPVGIVTSDSTVRALNHFKVTTSQLRVRDAMIKHGKTYRPDDDLFDLLDDLNDRYAVLVVDATGRLAGIVTSYDTTAYFRRRAQDTMFVQDIEEMIKSYVSLAFLDPQGELDQAAQCAAVEAITPSNKDLRGPFQRALTAFLQQQSGEAKASVKPAVVEQIFTDHLFKRDPVKPYDKLSLGEYIELLLHSSRWPQYEPVFGLGREALKQLLAAVRTTRNDLSHLRLEITDQQRDELQFCKDWLARHEAALQAAFMANPTASTESIEPVTPADLVTLDEPVTPTPEEPAPPLEEAAVADEGRYAPLIRFLQRQPISADRVQFSFDQIEQIIGEQLPESARKHRAWWANDTVSHAQSQQWLDVGWRVAGLSMTDERVTFARSRERERAYIDFFSALLSELKREAPETFRIGSPDGQSWINAGWIFNGISFNFAFTQTKRFRIELYIDVGEKESNKRIFDALLSRREALEDAFGEPLSWERIDDKRASRLARYYPGNIADNKGTLANLRARAVEGMIRFRRVLIPQLDAVLKEMGMAPSVSNGYREVSERVTEPTP